MGDDTKELIRYPRLRTRIHFPHVSFAIYPNEEPPEFWTDYFGILPDISIVKGQPFATPSGRKSRVPGRIGAWGIKSEKAVHSDPLTPHFRYLVDRLALPRADLRAQIERTKAKMRFFCYWLNESGNRIPDVPNDIRAMMEHLGGTIEIDEYR